MTGVKQGCVLPPPPPPHSLQCSFLCHAENCIPDDSHSMAIRCRTDGNLFNLRRLQSKSKVKEERVRDFLFADDCALKASSEYAWYAVEHEHVFVCLRYLWTRNQHKENGGHISASIPHKLLRSNHHSQGPEAANCRRQVHTSRQYRVQNFAFWMTKWKQELLKQAQLSEGFIRMCGNERTYIYFSSIERINPLFLPEI